PGSTPAPSCPPSLRAALPICARGAAAAVPAAGGGCDGGSPGAAGHGAAGGDAGWTAASDGAGCCRYDHRADVPTTTGSAGAAERDRKSTRLNSSHVKISYAVF